MMERRTLRVIKAERSGVLIVGYTKPCRLWHMRDGVMLGQHNSPLCVVVETGDVIELKVFEQDEGGDLTTAWAV